MRLEPSSGGVEEARAADGAPTWRRQTCRRCGRLLWKWQGRPAAGPGEQRVVQIACWHRQCRAINEVRFPPLPGDSAG